MNARSKGSGAVAIDLLGGSQRITGALTGAVIYIRLVRGGREHFYADQRVNADFDGDGVSSSLNDLKFLIRLMLVFCWERLTNGVIPAAATRTSDQI